MATLVIDDPPAVPPADPPFLPDKPFLSVREVAALLDVKPPTIHALLRSGELRGLRIGREWRIRRARLRGMGPAGAGRLPQTCGGRGVPAEASTGPQTQDLVPAHPRGAR